MMNLTVLLGPMASGKSLELIARVSPFALTDTKYRVYQSTRHQRDARIVSRTGAGIDTLKINTLGEMDLSASLLAVDEFHMFDPEEVEVLRVLSEDTHVVLSGIDLDHRGELFRTVQKVLELGPDQVLYRRAVCDVCHRLNAVYTQVLESGAPFLDDLGGRALPADGTYEYQPRCREHFLRP